MKVFDELWVSSTNNSESLSMAGTIATINEMKSKKTISKCWEVGEKLFSGWNRITEKHNLDAKMIGYPVRMDLQCFDSQKNESLALKSLLLQEMVKQGIFMSILGAVYLSYSHSFKDVQRTLDVLDDVCKSITEKVSNDNYEKYLEGNLPKTIWTLKMPSTKKR
jgi:glutamate-1-semialdehyde aminotransferase